MRILFALMGIYTLGLAGYGLVEGSLDLGPVLFMSFCGSISLLMGLGGKVE